MEALGSQTWRCHIWPTKLVLFLYDPIHMLSHMEAGPTLLGNHPDQLLMFGKYVPSRVYLRNKWVRWILCQTPLRNGLLMLDPLLVTTVEHIILVICLSETRVPHVSWSIVIFRVEIAILGCPHFWETQTAPEKSEMILRNGWDIILALISQHFTVSKWVFQLWSLHPIGVIEDDIPILHVILPIPNFNATKPKIQLL